MIMIIVIIMIMTIVKIFTIFLNYDYHYSIHTLYIYHVALQEWPPHFRQKFEEFEAGASLVRQTYHFNFRGPV